MSAVGSLRTRLAARLLRHSPFRGGLLRGGLLRGSFLRGSFLRRSLLRGRWVVVEGGGADVGAVSQGDEGALTAGRRIDRLVLGSAGQERVVQLLLDRHQLLQGLDLLEVFLVLVFLVVLAFLVLALLGLLLL